MYDESKRFAESAVHAYVQTHGLTGNIARIFNTYGPKMSKYDGRVISNFIIQSLSNAPISIYGDGTQTRSFCFIDDTLTGLIKLMDSSHSGPINIGNPNENKFNCGADFVITPTATFVNNNPPTTGSIISPAE